MHVLHTAGVNQAGVNQAVFLGEVARLLLRLLIFSKGSTKAFFRPLPSFLRPRRFFLGSAPGSPGTLGAPATIVADASLASASELAPRS